MGTKNNPGKFDCYAKADPDEPIFVLRGNDPTAAQTIQLWIRLNEFSGTSSEKIAEATRVIGEMRGWAFKQGGREGAARTMRGAFQPKGE